jgi:hypothetical protein
MKAAMRAAFRLTATEGIARLEKQARWLEREYPDAAASLREGLAEMFTVNRLGVGFGILIFGIRQRPRCRDLKNRPCGYSGPVFDATCGEVYQTLRKVPVV